MMALSDIISHDEMNSLVLAERKTHQQISDILKERNPGIRGLSAMSVRRFCTTNGIRTRTTLNEKEIEKEVSKCVNQVL